MIQKKEMLDRDYGAKERQRTEITGTGTVVKAGQTQKET